MLISTPSNTLYILELSVGFETNLDNNVDRKFSKYRYLLNDLTSKYRHVKLVNLSIGSLGIFGQSSDSFIQMCSDLAIDKAHIRYIITKLTTIIIHTAHYIFFMRNKPRHSTNSFPSSISSSYENHLLFSGSFFCLFLLLIYSFILFPQEITVIRPAEYNYPLSERFLYVCLVNISK